MKIKPSGKSGGVVVELSPRETQIPGESDIGKLLTAFALKKILVPVDFSECSIKALQYSVPMAKQFGAETVLVHVMQYPYLAAEAAVFEREALQAERDELDSLMRRVSKIVPSRVILRTGKPADEIVQVASETDADLIILSTHGRSGFSHALLGSVAERVVRLAPCPVLVVREKERDFVTERPEVLSAVT
jgi:nucleotide-binding universal stress UspA family protein